MLFTVPELVILCTYLSHVLSENCWATDSRCGQILPQRLYKMCKLAHLKLKGIERFKPLESAIQTAYWEGHLMCTYFASKEGMGWNPMSQWGKGAQSGCLEIRCGLIHIISLPALNRIRHRGIKASFLYGKVGNSEHPSYFKSSQYDLLKSLVPLDHSPTSPSA